jgi:site-specific DNA recombinase
MRAIGYVRVSTQEQSTDGVSLAAQEAKIRGYAALYDIELVGVIVDGGQSAKTLDRPGLHQVFAILKAKRADGLIISKLDRLTRSVADLATLLDGYFSEKAGRQLWSVGDSIDTRTAAGRMVLNILMSVSQWEREAIGERTRDALQHKDSQGELVGQIRYGLAKGDVVNLGTPDRRGRTAVQLVVPDPAELELLDRLKRWKLDDPHVSLGRLAQRLDGTGVPTKSGRPWSRATVRKLLVRMNIPTNSRSTHEQAEAEIEDRQPD